MMGGLGLAFRVDRAVFACFLLLFMFGCRGCDCDGRTKLELDMECYLISIQKRSGYELRVGLGTTPERSRNSCLPGMRKGCQNK